MTTIEPCGPEGVDILQRLSRETFRQTFGPVNTEEDMRDYLEISLGRDRLLDELRHPGSSFFLLHCDGVAAGYLKLNEAAAQTEINEPESLEIERIYVLGEFQGRGLGRTLMEKAFAEARARGRRFVWLGVWEENRKAIRFYEAAGFVRFGEHPFTLGSQAQIDWLMRKDVD